MPITKTAKRALRGSKRKGEINKIILSKLEIAVRKAKKSKSSDSVKMAVSLTDRAAKKMVIHKNKAARIKSSLSKLVKGDITSVKSKTKIVKAKSTSKKAKK